MAGMTGFSREVARRIFAEELKSSNYSFRDGEDQHQYAPSYLLTPTGAKCNRVFLVGTLTEKDDIGGDTEYWRGRVVDPTGSILIYAGQYQPEAAQILAGLEAPCFVAVVGKPNLYQTDDGNIIISIRAESISRVDEFTRNQWILDTARRTMERLSDLGKARVPPASGDFTTADSMPARDSSPAVLDAERAMQHYQTDIEHFRQMAIRALSTLKADLSGSTIADESALVKGIPVQAGGKSVGKELEETDALPRKGSIKKVGSPGGWPASDSDEEIETINIRKKS
jgi:RPA family protein